MTKKKRRQLSYFQLIHGLQVLLANQHNETETDIQNLFGTKFWRNLSKGVVERKIKIQKI